jgi:transcriptional regulator
MSWYREHHTEESSKHFQGACRKEDIDLMKDKLYAQAWEAGIRIPWTDLNIRPLMLEEGDKEQ